MTVTPESLVGNAGDLISMPDVFIRINDLAQDPTSSAVDFSRVIEQDAALTARLLKIVNSPYYGFPSSINTISRAITIIGIRDLRDLVLATTTVNALTKIDSNCFSVNNFWSHSLHCAVIARILAEFRQEIHAERFFVAGLLHDIGNLVMHQGLGSLCQQVMDRIAETGEATYTAEKAIIGFTHADVGAALARAWNLPADIIDIIQYHHEPTKAQFEQKDAMTIHLANYIADSLGESKLPNVASDELDPTVWELLELTPEVIHRVEKVCSERVAEMANLLFKNDLAA